MPSPSPFAEDWRECLRVHYQQVLHNQDHRTESTLIGVLHEVGFSDQELAEFTVRATLRAEDVGPDFVPDLNILQPEAAEPGTPPEVPTPEELEPALSAGVILDEAPAPDEPEAAVFESAAIEEAAAAEDESPALPSDEEPPDFRSADPQQLSMF